MYWRLVGGGGRFSQNHTQNIVPFFYFFGAKTFLVREGVVIILWKGGAGGGEKGGGGVSPLVTAMEPAGSRDTVLELAGLDCPVNPKFF